MGPSRSESVTSVLSQERLRPASAQAVRFFAALRLT
jgi:hypothetical protein